MDINNENPQPQANPGGVVQLPDGRFVPEAQYAQTLAHAEQMGAPDPYVDPDKPVDIQPYPLPEELQTKEVSEAPEEVQAAETEPEASEEAEVPTSEDALEVLAEQARGLSEEGWSDEAIDAWTELPEDERKLSNPDGTVRLEHFNPREMTERQEKLVYAEIMTKGELNPAYAKQFAENYGVSIEMVQQHVANYRQAELNKAHEGASADRAHLGLNEQEYTEMIGWFNNQAEDAKSHMTTELSDPNLRPIALEGIKVLWQRDAQAAAPAPAPNNMNMNSTLPSDVRPVQQADGSWILQRVNR